MTNWTHWQLPSKSSAPLSLSEHFSILKRIVLVLQPATSWRFGTRLIPTCGRSPGQPQLSSTQASCDCFQKNTNQHALVSCSRMIISAPSTFSSADTAIWRYVWLCKAVSVSLRCFMNVRKNVEKEDKCVSAQCRRHTKTILRKCIFSILKGTSYPQIPLKGISINIPKLYLFLSERAAGLCEAVSSLASTLAGAYRTAASHPRM